MLEAKNSILKPLHEESGYSQKDLASKRPKIIHSYEF